MKRIILILALICMIVFPACGQTGNYTTHNLFYLPDYGAYGLTEYNEYNDYMEIADAQIWANKTGLTLRYLKTEVDDRAKFSKWDATSAPTVNDDVDLGYLVGSRWCDITNDKGYVCLDNTDGAAVWTETTGAGGGVDTSGTPVQYDIARFTDENTIEGLDYAELKAALDLEIGTDVQAYDAGLLSLAGLTYASPSFIKVTANDTYAIRTIAETLTDLEIDLDLYYTKTEINHDKSYMKWPGLEMCYEDVYDTLANFDIYCERLLANGFTQIRIHIADWAYSEDVDVTKVWALRAITNGLDVIWGVGSPTTELTAANWAAYHTAIDGFAAWAESNGIFEFLIGNEEEFHNDDTTLTDAQLRINLRALATSVQAIFTIGDVTYGGSCAHLSDWVTEGRGDIDQVPFMVYMDEDWKNNVDTIFATWGADHTYINEWNVDSGGYVYYSEDEAVQAAGIAEMLEYIKVSGLTRAFFFCYTDTSFFEGFEVLKTDATYRKMWGSIINSNLHLENEDTALGVQLENTVYEGATADAFETTFAITDPTADRIITFPDSNQTLDLSLYYLKTAIDTQGEVESIWGDILMNDLIDDTAPQLGGQLQAGAHSVNFTEQVLTPGTAVAWDLGNSNKATLTPAQNFTITITAPSGALNAQLIVTQDGTGSRVMDEIITQADATVATTDVHTDTEIIDLTVDIPTGARIRIDNQEGTDVPLPLVENTVYYAIRSSENHIQVATTKALAIAGTNLDITDQGSGTHTVEQLVKWTGGTLGVLTTDAGAEDILGLTYKTADKQWYAMLSNDFQ